MIAGIDIASYHYTFLFPRVIPVENVSFDNSQSSNNDNV